MVQLDVVSKLVSVHSLPHTHITVDVYVSVVVVFGGVAMQLIGSVSLPTTL